MSFLFPLLYILLGTATITIITKKRFGFNLPVLFMITAFFLFFSQVIFKTFNIGFYCLIIGSLLSIPILIYYKFKNKELLQLFKNNYFTNGLICFLTMYFLITVIDFKRIFSRWDEFSHWGEMVKEMLRLDRFYSVKESTLLAHKDYPPILQLYELFFIKLIGTYSETMLIKSIHIFEFGLFVPCITDSIKEKKISTMFVSIFIFLLIYFTTLLFDGHNIINTIYTDYSMAIIVSYMLVFVIISKDRLSHFTIINLSLSSSFLLLTKQMGIPLYLMIPFLYIVLILINKQKGEKKILNNKKIIEIIILLFIVPTIIWFGWNRYVKTINFEAQFKLSDIRVFDLVGVLKGTRGEDYQKVSAINYIKAIETRNLTTSYIKMNYYQAIGISILFIYLLSYFGKNIFKSKDMKLLVLTLFIGSIGYAFVMLNMYVFGFKEIEGPNLASFDRYMSTFVLLVWYVGIMLFLYFSFEKGKNIYIIILSVLMFVIQSPKMTKSIMPHGYSNTDTYYISHSNYIKQHIEKDTSKVFIVAQNTVGDYQFYLKYYANPIIVNKKDFSWPIDSDDSCIDYYNNIKEELKEYDYLYLARIDNNFKNKYKFVFKTDDISEYELFKIKKNYNDNILLEKVVN